MREYREPFSRTELDALYAEAVRTSAYAERPTNAKETILRLLLTIELREARIALLEMEIRHSPIGRVEAMEAALVSETETELRHLMLVDPIVAGLVEIGRRLESRSRASAL